MSTLIIVTIVIFLLAWSNNRVKNHGVIIMLCFLFASRSMDVPDTINYYEIFRYPMSESMFQYEYGYLYLNYICHDLLSMQFSTYLFLLSFFMLESWYYCTSKLIPKAHMGLIFLFYIVFYGYYFDGVVIRNGLGICICYIGFLFLNNPKIIKYIIYIAIVALAFSLHVGTLLFLLVPFLNKSLSKKTLYVWVTINLILIIFTQVDFVQNMLNRLFALEELKRLNAYGDESARSGNGLSVFFILNYVLSVLMVIFRDCVRPERQKVYNFFLNIVLLGVCLDCATNTINSASRAGAQFIYFSSIPIYLLCYESSLFSKKDGGFVIYTLSFVYFFALIHYFPRFLNY